MRSIVLDGNAVVGQDIDGAPSRLGKYWQTSLSVCRVRLVCFGRGFSMRDDMIETGEIEMEISLPFLFSCHIDLIICGRVEHDGFLIL